MADTTIVWDGVGLRILFIVLLYSISIGATITIISLSSALSTDSIGGQNGLMLNYIGSRPFNVEPIPPI